jgi:hypothetical protein
MEAQGDELIELARETGPKGVKAYRQVVKAIGDSEDAEVVWKTPGREPATMTSVAAGAAYATLAREGERESDKFVVVGHLSMADADLNRFKLKLPKGAPRPPQLKNKRVVEGAYAEPVGQLVKEKGLWDSDVSAEILIDRERADTVAAPRVPKYRLIAVERAVEAPPDDRGGAAIPGSTQMDV